MVEEKWSKKISNTTVSSKKGVNWGGVDTKLIDKVGSKSVRARTARKEKKRLERVAAQEQVRQQTLASGEATDSEDEEEFEDFGAEGKSDVRSLPTSHYTNAQWVKRSKKGMQSKKKKLQVRKSSDCRVIINAVIEGVKVRVLCDGGACVDLISAKFVKKHMKAFAPVYHERAAISVKGVVEGGPTISSKADLVALITSGEYAEELNIPVFSDIDDPNYDMILGRPWHIRNRYEEDWDADASESVTVRPRGNGKFSVNIVSNVQLLSYKGEGPVGAGVYKVSAVSSAPAAYSQLEEIEIAHHRHFKKVQKQALNQERKEEKAKKKGSAFKCTVIACLLTCAMVGSTVVETDASSLVASAVTSVVAGLSALVHGLGQASVHTAAAYSGLPPDQIAAVDIHGLVDGQGKSWHCTGIKNPYLPPSEEVLTEMNVTMPAAKSRLAQFLGRDWSCKGEMPHKSKIVRAPEDTMSIHFVPGKENFVPRRKVYKTPKHLLPVLKKILMELVEKGFIQPSTSPYSSGCMLVVKPHQEGTPLDKLKYRLVVDLRDINALTVPMHHRIPDINAIWQGLSNASVISCLDLAHGFHQENLNIADGSAAKTAFSTEFGHWEFVGCVMGARNTPAFFQHRVEQELRKRNLLDVGMLRVGKDGKVEVADGHPCCTPYIDDLLIYSKNLDDHFKDLERVFSCLDEAQYFIRPEKCHFCCKYALFCGGIVGNGVLAMDPLKVEAVEKWCKPTNITELRSFLGMCNYLKAWYKNYSDQSGVLTGLLKKGKCVKNDWGPEHDKAFQNLKTGFKKYPILRLPDWEKQFYLVTDSCDHALGGMVAQMYEKDGKQILMPVAYHSRKFSKHEVNYSVREQECLAIIDCFKKFEYLLLGSAFEIIMKTDHSSLKQVEQGGSLQSSKRLARWAEYLGNFAYTISWIPGKENLVGDGISRSITATTGTQVVTGEKLRLPSVAGFSTYTGDARMDNFDYNNSLEFKEVYQKLLAGESDIHLHPEIRYFELLGNKLYYRLSEGDLALCIPEGHRFCMKPTVSKAKIPIREILLKECHESPYMGHRGINKTYAQMRKLFYWKSMHREVRRFVGTCATCMRAKASRRAEMLPCKGKDCPAGPLHSVAIDFITGLPPVTHKSFPGRKITTAAVLVDRFTKKVFIEPMPEDVTAEETAETLNEKVFQEHGWPLELISDRDTKFVSKFWQKLFELVGTKLKFGYAYHQRFDGQAEALNGVIKEIMRCYIDRNQENWMVQLPHIASCINNSLNTKSGFTPNEIYYGRALLRPVEQQFSLIKGFASVKHFMDTRITSRHIAEEVVRQGVTAYVKQFNKRVPLTVIDPRIKPGSLVFVSAKNIKQPNLQGRPSRKLDPKRVGPFKVLEKVGSTGFKLDMPGYPHHKEFHAHSLTPYEEGLEFESRAALKTADHVDRDTGLEMWVVDHISARRKHYRKLYYFVMYEGYGVEEGEWILRSELMIDCPSVVADYESQHPLPANSGIARNQTNVTSAPARRSRRLALQPEPEISASTGNGVVTTP